MKKRNNEFSSNNLICKNLKIQKSLKRINYQLNVKRSKQMLKSRNKLSPD